MHSNNKRNWRYFLPVWFPIGNSATWVVVIFVSSVSVVANRSQRFPHSAICSI